ncbi:MAG: hypothetical protein ABIS47_03800, partial [Acidimicrobiales bacterium]
MEILTYLAVLRRRWLLIAITVAVALGLASASAPSATLYDASSTIVVGPRQLSTDANQASFSGDLLNNLANLTISYAVLIDSAVVAEDAIRRTGVARTPDGVVGATTATAVPGTQVLRISVADPDPAVAQALANGMATAFVERITSLAPDAPPAAGAPPAVPVYLYQLASRPAGPRPLSNRTRLFTAGLFGLLASIGAVLLLDHLDLSIRTVADAERRLGLPVLGAV